MDTALLWPSLLWIGIGLAIAMAGAWVVQRLTRNSGWVDTIWSFATGAGGIAAAVLPVSGTLGLRQIVVAVLVALWAGAWVCISPAVPAAAGTIRATPPWPSSGARRGRFTCSFSSRSRRRPPWCWSWPCAWRRPIPPPSPPSPTSPALSYWSSRSSAKAWPTASCAAFPARTRALSVTSPVALVAAPQLFLRMARLVRLGGHRLQSSLSVKLRRPRRAGADVCPAGPRLGHSTA